MWTKEAIDDRGNLQRDAIVSESQREVDPCDRDVWRSNVRSAMLAATQLPGGKRTNVDGAPAGASYI